MMNFAILESAGIDVQEVLDRMMGNEALLERLLNKFLDDDSCECIERAVGSKDVEGAISASHALKGIAGNLSIRPVYLIASQQCDLFRSGNWDRAVGLLPQLSGAVEKAKSAVRDAS